MATREIKFRAWDKEFKRMKVTGMGLNGGVLSGEEVEIMQYTGLKDKNGKEIYEGDIVRYDDICGDDFILQTGKKTTGIVNWIDDCCAFLPQEIEENHKGGHYVAHWDFIEAVEVIGNIYENSNLLKGE
jgi:uncharacterized phage protein (TIGR01671 family)